MLKERHATCTAVQVDDTMIYLWDMSKNVNNRTGTFPNLYSTDVDNRPLAQILGSSFLARSVLAPSMRYFLILKTKVFAMEKMHFAQLPRGFLALELKP